MFLIAASGKARAGKDTLFSLLREVTNLNVERMAFADPLKAEVAAACGYPVETIEENKALFRPMLQWWGTEFRRGFCNDDYWLDRFKRNYSALRCIVRPPDIVVATDVRFPNEVRTIHELGGIVVRVERGGVETGSHASEVALDGAKFDYVIRNDGTLEDYKEAVRVFWRAVQSGRVGK